MNAVKSKVIDVILDSMSKNGRPSTSSEAIDLLTQCLQDADLLVDKPTDSGYDSVKAQVFDLISQDVSHYGKASSNSMGAQRAYNVLSDAGLVKVR